MTHPIHISLPTGLKVGPANVYLFTKPVPVLVDTGLHNPIAWQALQSALADHNLALADLERVLITHPHIDHCGQVGPIVQHSQAEVWIGQVGAGFLLEYKKTEQAQQAYYRDRFLPETGLDPAIQAQMLTGLDHLVQTFEPVSRSRVRALGVGQTVELGGLSWQLLHLPGHCRSQTCFYQPETRQFIAGDMLLHRTPSPVVEYPLDDGQRHRPGLPDFMASLTRVAALNIDTVYPGHGDPFGDPTALIATQRARIATRQAECLSLVQAGVQTPAALMLKMYGSQAYLAALWMVTNYLDRLEIAGQVTWRLVAGVAHYEPV